MPEISCEPSSQRSAVSVQQSAISQKPFHINGPLGRKGHVGHDFHNRNLVRYDIVFEPCFDVRGRGRRSGGQLDKRLKCSRYGLTAAKELGLLEDEIWFKIQGLGSVYLLRGNYDNTKKFLDQGILLAQEHNLPDGIALGETYLSYMALQADNLAEARQHVEQALSNAEGPLFKYRAHHAAGHVARYLEDLVEVEVVRWLDSD